MIDIRYPAAGESIEDYLWRLGCLKKAGAIDTTWTELAEILNEYTGNTEFDESTWRKRFQKMCSKEGSKARGETSPPEESLAPSALEGGDVDGDESLRLRLQEAKETVLARDERAAMNRAIRSAARNDALFDLLKAEITRYDNTAIPYRPRMRSGAEKAVYVMLSDLHYGLSFNSRSGKYNSDIAKSRLGKYADAIIAAAAEQNIGVCYVSLMGDMISGNIHTAIRVENRENIVEQIIGASEAVAEFLASLSSVFQMVFVNGVPGNHSRVELSADGALRKEKLDSLIPWYCKARLENCKNIVFVNNEIDDTIAQFRIYGKNYIAVHGDYDNNLAHSAQNIARMTNESVDYLLAGHLHVPDIKLEHVGYIRNGCLCGSGDDYTVRNRLFAPPYQLFLICTPSGVESMHPVRFGGEECEPVV